MPGCAVRNASPREPIADCGKMVPDFKKVVPDLVTKHTAFVKRKCYGNFLCVYNQVISFALMLSETMK
jgi:hypothetical protein